MGREKGRLAWVVPARRSVSVWDTTVLALGRVGSGPCWLRTMLVGDRVGRGPCCPGTVLAATIARAIATHLRLSREEETARYHNCEDFKLLNKRFSLF